MRKVIYSLSVIGAGLLAMSALAGIADLLLGKPKLDGNSMLLTAVLTAASVFWMWSSIVQLTQQKTLAWFGCLVPSAVLVWGASEEYTRLDTLLWRAQHGDPAVQLDPGLGIPWLISHVFLLFSIVLFAAVAIAPSFRWSEERTAQPTAAPNGGPASPPPIPTVSEGPPSVS
jgi:hypothetical protein